MSASDQLPVEWIPSLFAADPLYFGEALKWISTRYRSVHLDLMDGHFVPNISFGPAMIGATKRAAPHLRIEVHLMVTHPENFIPHCIEEGAQRIFIPSEVPSVLSACQQLQSSSLQWGLVVNPDTPLSRLSELKSWVSNAGHLLIMGVHPGFCGQNFIEGTYERIAEIRRLFPKVVLSVDGGINFEIAQKLAALGVTYCVAGSYCFSKEGDLKINFSPKTFFLCRNRPDRTGG